MISLLSKSPNMARSSGRQLSSLSPPPPPSLFLPSSSSATPSSSPSLGRRSYTTPPPPPKRYTPRSIPKRPASVAASLSSSSPSSSTSAFLPAPHAISAVPFSHPPSEVAGFLESRSSIHAAFWFPSQWVRRWLRLKIDVKLVRFEAVYLPCWMISGEVKAPFTSRYDTTTRDVRVSMESSFFPGTTETPFKWISCAPSLSSLPQLEPFKPSLLTQFGRKIRALPFELSPLVLPSLTNRLPYLNVGDHVVVDAAKSIEWRSLDAVPLYLPFYVASYKHPLMNFDLILEDTQEDLKDCFYNVDYAWPEPTDPKAPHDDRRLLHRWSLTSHPSDQLSKDPTGLQQPIFALGSKVAEPLEYRKDLAKEIAEQGSKRVESWLDAPGNLELVKELSAKGLEGAERFVGRMGGSEVR
ncbi:hypothetical protein BDY24DRAFT_437575 [Mrakia frigida]|uniref:uncharacterized protein n=1 Tax=Mrakia frigida TaxID=29902 RepID=UPI003FCC05AC